MRQKKKRRRTWRLHLHLFRGDFLLFRDRDVADEDVGGWLFISKKRVQTIHKKKRLCARDQTSSLRTTARRKDAEIKEEECDNAALRDETSRGGRARVAERIVERHRVNVINESAPP